MTGNNSLGFGIDLDHNTETGILEGIFPLQYIGSAE